MATSIYLRREVKIVASIVKKAYTKLPAKYSDYANDFLPDLIIELAEHIKTNNHAINFVKDK